MRHFTLSLVLLLAPLTAQDNPPWDLTGAQRQALVRAARSAGTASPGSTRALTLNLSSRIDPDLADLIPTASERSLGLPKPVRVEMTSSSLSTVPAVEAAVRRLGGQVQSTFQTTLFIEISPDRLPELATLSEVSYISPIRSISALQSTVRPIVSDGLQVANFDALRRAGATGRGVKVGILDLGYGGYSNLVRQGRLPNPLAARAFPDSHGVENSEVHGTACAEIVAAAAPQAALYIAAYNGTQDEFLRATNWLISQGVKVISFSMGSAYGPSNGDDFLSRVLEETTRKNGVLWVVSAGNEAQNHWSTLARDTDKDGFVDTGNRACPGLQILPTADTLEVTVKWDDWGPNPLSPNSTLDLDLALVGYLPGPGESEFELMASSTRTQGPGVPPMELIRYSKKDLHRYRFCLILAAKKLTRPVRLHVFLKDGHGKLLPSSAAGSIMNPATARSALAVGAVDVLSRSLAGYSSQGPTDDNRVKPDVAAPTNTISLSYANQGGRFPGTSASCPHVAGFAALLLSLQPNLSPTALRQRILESVAPMGASPNFGTGHGVIDGARAVASAPVRPPVPKVVPPSTEIAIPAEFGATVSAATLNLLRSTASAARDGLQVRVVTGSELYHVGDGMRLGLIASEEASCLLFNSDPERGFTLALPLESLPLRLEAGKSVVLPPDDAATLEVVEPLGPSEILLVCAKHPQPLNSVRTNPANWAAAVQPYFVSPAREPIP